MGNSLGKFVFYLFLLAIGLPILADSLVLVTEKVTEALTILLNKLGMLALWLIGIAAVIRFCFVAKSLWEQYRRSQQETQLLQHLTGIPRNPLEHHHLLYDPHLFEDPFNTDDSGPTGEDIHQPKSSPQAPWHHDVA